MDGRANNKGAIGNKGGNPGYGFLEVIRKRVKENSDLWWREWGVAMRSPNKEMKKMAIKAAKVLNYQITGVDIMIDSQTGKKWLLEANRGPGFTYDLKKSPELPAVASFFAKKLKLKKCR